MEFGEILEYPLPDQIDFAVSKEFGPLAAYYQMCQRYGVSYFEDNPGNTVYHLVLQDRTVIFTFCREKSRRFVLFLVYKKKEMDDAWLHVTEDVERIRRETRPDNHRVTEGDRCFKQNLEQLQNDVNRSLKPFSFIISCLPEECFPQADHVRLYNTAHVREARLEELMVSLHDGDREARVFPEYSQMRETMLRESPLHSRTSDWVLLRIDGMGRKGRRKMIAPIKSEDDPDILRMSSIEKAFDLLWKK